MASPRVLVTFWRLYGTYKELGGSKDDEGSTELLRLTPLAFLLSFSHLQVQLAHLVPREGVCALRPEA